MELKRLISIIYNRILLFEIWDSVKKCVKDDLNKGNIILVLNKHQKKFFTCPEKMPSEYFTEENIEQIFFVETDMGQNLKIVQKNLGIGFESECDEIIFIIFDENENVLYYSSSKENNSVYTYK